MIVFAAAAVPIVLGAVSGRAAPAIARRMQPAPAAVMLTALALTVSVATGLMLCVAGALAVAEVMPMLRPRDWTLHTLRASLPLPPALGIVAGAFGITLLGLAVVHVVRVAWRVRTTSEAARALPCVDGLTILDDDAAHAFAVPGRHARVVVSTGLLRLLGGAQRRAVLEHEQAHLRHRHHLYAQLSRLAAAANPFLRPVATAVDVALERWADGEAVRAVGDRATVAHALGAVALAHPSVPAGALGVAQHAVVERVRYLLEPPPRRLRGAGLLTVAILACWACAALVLLHIHEAIELAEGVAARR